MTLQHPISEADIHTYERDGVVCIRGQFDADLLGKGLALCVDHSTKTAVSLVAADDADGGPGRTIASSHMARTSLGFMDIVANSPAAEIAARLMVVPDVR